MGKSIDKYIRFKYFYLIVNNCWEWQGDKTREGYGRFWMYGKNRMAHKVSYLWYIGEIPTGLIICHKCDNPKCVNPMHLFLGTHKDNTQDCIKKGRFGSRPTTTHPSIQHYWNGCKCDDCKKKGFEYYTNRKNKGLIVRKSRKKIPKIVTDTIG